MVTLLLILIYLSFISLGLPDSLLGAAWPSIYQEFQVPVSYSGLIFMLTSAGTTISSLNSDRLVKRFGAKTITVISVFMTALALFGFSMSRSYLALCLLALPYGLGAGSIDAALNNYVALHFSSKHMSWLHCMWGLGAMIGPYIMGRALATQNSWNLGYRSVGIIQLTIAIILLISVPFWKKTEEKHLSKDTIDSVGEHRVKSLKELLALPGAIQVCIVFVCYCATEQAMSLWASTYLNLYRGLPVETAASFAGFFYIGITAGRFLTGLLTYLFNNKQLIFAGMGLIGLGAICLLIPSGELFSILGLSFVGLGCAPIFPCLIHEAPRSFGIENSQGMIGIQMASAYLGTALIPPLLGVVADYLGIGIFPYYMGIILLIMIFFYVQLLQKTKHTRENF